MNFVTPIRTGNRARHASAGRRGFTLLECTAAIVILSAALVLSLQLQVAAAGQRRAAEQRQLAGREVANLMERLTAEPWSTLDSEHGRQLTLSERAVESLRDAKLTIEVTDQPTEKQVLAKRIHVALAWRGRSGELSSPVRLTSWIFAPQSSTNGNESEITP